MDLIIAPATASYVNVEKFIQSVVVYVLRTSYNNSNVIFLTYLFDGSPGLLLDDAR